MLLVQGRVSPSLASLSLLPAPTRAAFRLWQLQACRWHSGPFSPVTFLVLFSVPHRETSLYLLYSSQKTYIVFSHFYPLKVL